MCWKRTGSHYGNKSAMSNLYINFYISFCVCHSMWACMFLHSLHLLLSSGIEIDGTTVEVTLAKPVDKDTLALHRQARRNRSLTQGGMSPIAYLPVADSCGGSYFAPLYGPPSPCGPWVRIYTPHTHTAGYSHVTHPHNWQPLPQCTKAAFSRHVSLTEAVTPSHRAYALNLTTLHTPNAIAVHPSHFHTT